MKHIRETFTDEEFDRLQKAKGNKTWHDFIMIPAQLEEGLREEQNKRVTEIRTYRQGSPYECFLAGVIQGIHYAIYYPSGRISMRSNIEGKSKKEDIQS